MDRHLFATLLAFGIPALCYCAEYPPQDHGGANVFLQDGDVIWGEHTNVGVFSVANGARVIIRPYDGDTPSQPYGQLAVEAHVVIVAGNLDAAGSGYTGAGGGGGGAGSWPGLGGTGGAARYIARFAGSTSLSGYGGADGCPGSLSGCGFSTGGGAGRDGDGPFAGVYEYHFNEDRLEWERASGGYAAKEANGDTSIDDSLLIGSGACSGAGGFGLREDAGPGTAGYGGASGGSGGGKIRLHARDLLEIRDGSVITADGTMGRPRNPAVPATGPGAHGSPGADAWPPDPNVVINMTDWLVTGGAGAGGGILLRCDTPGGLELAPTARISSLGGGASRLTVNGGTVKLFYSGVDPETSGVLIEAGRVYKASSSAAGPMWSLME